jgi:hypothetical protein
VGGGEVKKVDKVHNVENERHIHGNDDDKDEFEFAFKFDSYSMTDGRKVEGNLEENSVRAKLHAGEWEQESSTSVEGCQ